MAISLNLDANTFSALKSNSFKIYLASQFVAVSGIWVQRIATSWLVYNMTASATKLGVIELITNIPIFIFGLLAGAWLEKHDVRKTMLTTQSLAMTYSIIMAMLIYSNTITFSYIVALNLSLGIITAIDMPARQSSILLMIENKKSLKSALALQSMTFNVARFVGPSIGGLIVYNFGEATCFSITAICYIPVIYALYIIRLKERDTTSIKDQSIIKGVIDGIIYVKNFYPLLIMFIFLASFGMFSYSYNVFFPIFAKDILGGSSRFLGIIMGLFGLGAIIGAFSVASIMQFRSLPKSIAIVSLLYSICIAIFAISTNNILSLIIVIPAGLGLVATFIGTSTLIQTIARIDMRSRVISLYTICNLGLGPIGCFFAGFIIDYLNPQHTVLLWCLCMASISIILLKQVQKINKELEPIWNNLD